MRKLLRKTQKPHYQPQVDPQFERTRRPYAIPTADHSFASTPSAEEPRSETSSEGFQHLDLSPAITQLAAEQMILDANEERNNDEEVRREREHNSTISRIRELRGMIREKRRLDIEIWNKRNVQKSIRPVILKKCEAADNLYDEIIAIVTCWEKDQFDDEDENEWQLVKKIKSHLLADRENYTPWMKEHPWEREQPKDMLAYGWK